MTGEPTPSLWFRCRRIVEFRDTDAAGIAHFSAFFFWMESAEHEFLRELGLRVVDNNPKDAETLLRDLPPGEEHRKGLEVSWPRVSVSADYKSAVRFGDKLDVFIAVAKRGTCSLSYQFRFENSGSLVATGTVVVVRCLMRQGLKPLPVKIPEDILEQMQSYQLPDSDA
jgi:4-hydroxybenzoyl-CoA thioesterase/acyl-CoA thioester hydrolase